MTGEELYEEVYESHDEDLIEIYERAQELRWDEWALIADAIEAIIKERRNAAAEPLEA